MDEVTYSFPNRWNGDIHTIIFRKTYYLNNHSLCISMIDVSEGYEQPYATLTVNLPESAQLAWDEAFIDANNLGEDICSWLEENNIAYDLGLTVPGGYCTYPLFKFTENFLSITAEN